MGCLVEHLLKSEFLCGDPRRRVQPHIGLIDPSHPSTSPFSNPRSRSSSEFWYSCGTVCEVDERLFKTGLGPCTHRLRPYWNLGRTSIRIPLRQATLWTRTELWAKCCGGILTVTS